MNEQQRIVYMNAQILCCQIEFEAMKSANHVRRSENLADAYDEKAFMDLINRNGLGHNACITELVGH